MRENRTSVCSSRRILRKQSLIRPHLPATILSQLFHLNQRLMNLFAPSGLQTKLRKYRQQSMKLKLESQKPRVVKRMTMTANYSGQVPGTMYNLYNVPLTSNHSWVLVGAGSGEHKFTPSEISNVFH